MIKFLKRLILKIFEILGYGIIGKKELVIHNSFDAIHKFIQLEVLKKKESDLLIFDVGANDGGSIIRFKKIFPNSIVHSFEPNPKLVDFIKKEFNHDDVIINQIAFSKETAKRKFYYYESHRISSFYPMVENSKYKIQRFKNSEETNVSYVETDTIDNYCESNQIDKINILKIDTQGSEAEVLQGSTKLLKNQSVDIIELEYIIGIAHKNANSLFDIELSLKDYGYKLIAIENSGNILSFSNYQTNLIYAKKEIFEKIKNLHEKNLDILNVTKAVKTKWKKKKKKF